VHIRSCHTLTAPRDYPRQLSPILFDFCYANQTLLTAFPSVSPCLISPFTVFGLLCLAQSQRFLALPKASTRDMVKLL
jgi:hypothetical protein